MVTSKKDLFKVFGDSLNESRDPDREGAERYTSRLYLKHQCFERVKDFSFFVYIIIFVSTFKPKIKTKSYMKFIQFYAKTMFIFEK